MANLKKKDTRRTKQRKEREKKEKEKIILHKNEYRALLKQGIIKFNHPFREKWDYFIILLSIYNCIELPMDAAFNYRKSENTSGIAEPLNNLIDTMFAFDIIMNFRTTTMNRLTGEEIVAKKEIQNNYIKGQFIIDILSTIPFDLVASLFMSSENGEQSVNL